MTNKRILILISLLLFSFLLVGCNWLTPNQPPVITTDALPDATVGTAYIATVEATDADGDVLAFSLVGPIDMVISEVGVISGWTPTEVGTEDVTVIVTDGEVSVSADFTIEVTDAKLPVYNIDKDKYYDTIQAAINDANVYNTIEVAPGVYVDVVDDKYKKKVLINVDGLTLKSVEKHGAEIEGFVIVQADAVTIEDFYINSDTAINQPPIDLMEIDGVTIIGNKIEGGSDFGGINSWDGPNGVGGLVFIEDNEIVKGCIGLEFDSRSALVTIRNNTMIEPGDEGIWMQWNENAVLTIENNTVTDAGGKDVKIVHKPVSVNGVYDETKMAKAILDANLGIDSVYLQWTGITWLR